MITNFPSDGGLRVPRVAGLHSKLWTRRFPNCGRLVERIQALLTPVFKRLEGDVAMRRVLHAAPLDKGALREAMREYGECASAQVVQEALGRLDTSDAADEALRAALHANANKGADAASTLRLAIAEHGQHASTEAYKDAHEALSRLQGGAVPLAAAQPQGVE